MNGVILGSVIAGIVVMMSLSIIPASASHIENTCVIQKSNPLVMKCRNEIADGQGVQIINRVGSFAGNCLYDTTENGSNWDFLKESESVGNCAESLSWAKSNVQVR